MNLRPEVRTRARGDVVRQFRWYCKHGGLDVADCFMAAVDDEILRLSECPHLGVRLRFPARSFRGYYFVPLARPFGDFLLFYQFDAKTLEVMRILHGAREIHRRLREQPAVYGSAPASTLALSP